MAADAADALDFLEVECLDEGEELVLRVLDGVVDEAVREEDGVVGELDLADGLADADLELLLRLDSISNASAQLLEARRVDEEEVALEGLPVDLDGALDVDLDDGDLAAALDAFQLRVRRAVPDALRALPVLDKRVLLHHGLEVCAGHELEVLLGLLVSLPHGARRH